MPDEPKFGRLPAAQRRSGLSRGALYNIAAQNPGLFLKLAKPRLSIFKNSTPCWPTCRRPKSKPASPLSVTATPSKTPNAGHVGRRSHFKG